MADRPNVLYIHSHDTGRYVQPYGYAIPTPGIAQLAADGTLFRQAFCANPTCSPSRASLVSGTYPHQNGMFGLAHLGWEMNDYGKHIAHTMRGAGYATALSGIQHIVENDKMDVLGYDEVLVRPGVRGSPQLEAASWVYRRSQQPDQPWFLSVGFGETHRGFPTENLSVDPRFVKPPDPLPDTPQTRFDMAGYITDAQRLDRKMNTVFKALEESGQLDNTLIICTTDHGIAFPRMKCNLNDSGMGVMLIMRGPGGFTSGKAVDALVSHLDLYPTICEVCGIDKPSWLEGVSLTPLVNGQAASVRESVFAEVNYHVSYEPMRCVRTDRYKYIVRYGDRSKPVLPNCDASPSKQAWLDAGWLREDREALYDLATDPHEMRNLVGRAEAEPVLEAMRRRLAQWQQRTGDPILDGPIEPPDSALFCDIDAEGPDSPKRPISQHPQY